MDNVGLVVWQSAFVLAEYLLRHPPFGQWHDVHAVDLGGGTGEHCWSVHVYKVNLYVAFTAFTTFVQLQQTSCCVAHAALFSAFISPRNAFLLLTVFCHIDFAPAGVE